MPSHNSVSVEVVQELESTVRQLEKENAMLQDALEDMSQSLNASHISGTHVSGTTGSSSNNVLSPNHHQQQLHPNYHHPMASHDVTKTSSNNNNSNENKRWHQEYVELQSRYEVTQTRLNDAYSENHTLREQLLWAHQQTTTSAANR
jgi:hypothetical protein